MGTDVTEMPGDCEPRTYLTAEPGLGKENGAVGTKGSNI